MSRAAAPHLQTLPEPGKNLSLLLTVAVHLLLGGLLAYNISWQTKPAQSVAVELVTAADLAPTPEPAPQAEPEPAPEPEPVKPEPKPEPKPVVDTPPPAKPDIAIKEKVEKKVEKKTEKKIEPVEKKPLLPTNTLDDRLSKELNQISKNKAASSIDKELANLKTGQQAAANAKLLNDYLGRIRAKIRGNIVLPPDVKGNPEAVFDVTQLPGGDVISAKLRRSTGNPALDTAIERAILKSSPLPKPAQSDLFARDLSLKFRPLEE